MRNISPFLQEDNKASLRYTTSHLVLLKFNMIVNFPHLVGLTVEAAIICSLSKVTMLFFELKSMANKALKKPCPLEGFAIVASL